jgi:uncharacterized protein (DUF302 family)
MSSKWFNVLAVSAVAIFILNGCDSSKNNNSSSKGDGKDNSQKEVFSDVRPYQRVAIIPGTQDDIQSIALKISDYVVYTDEAKKLGFPSNWAIAGANPKEGETYDRDDDLIPIPVDTGDGVYKSRVIEFCNGAYARKALASGQHYGSALPCEVSVHSDGKNVYVDMLDSKAIFTIFFPNNSNQESLQTMGKAINAEIRTMILSALVEDSVTKSTEPLGPQFTQNELDSIEDGSIYQVSKYQSSIGSTFSDADARRLSERIIANLGNKIATADTNVVGLSEGSSWRSARPAPIAVTNIYVTEACSPTYAEMATKLGAEYITALPCEATIYLDDADSSGKTISISILNPHFMFETMFKGAVAKALKDKKISKDEAKKYETLATTVLNDLNRIVDASIVDSGLSLKKIN